jgi:hypothetical protein
LIDFDGVESIRLFSGFRGSGKTTELHRLQVSSNSADTSCSTPMRSIM